ncbi:hypothetical protein PybrP1_012708 [[Pythium] brassicae (nom. inval.)]|nr:hypothetical protein PybrP1_012708 [[Pythium] brassicae (nom. inval.)]
MASAGFTPSFSRPFQRISPTELAKALRADPSTGSRPLVIDVRDEDFAGGHIRSAVNLPEENFVEDDDVDAIVRRHKDEELIVFHCMFSQVRGPSCARRFVARMAVVLADADHTPDVRVLTGGYQGFANIYKDDADLIEQ